MTDDQTINFLCVYLEHIIFSLDMTFLLNTFSHKDKPFVCACALWIWIVRALFTHQGSVKVDYIKTMLDVFTKVWKFVSRMIKIQL